MIWKILLPITIIATILLAGASIYFSRNPRQVTEIRDIYTNFYTSEKTAIDLEFEKLGGVEEINNKVEDLYISGWIPEWGISSGLQTITNNEGLFDSVSPIWFFLNPDGSLKPTTQTNGENQIKFFNENSIELIPSLQEFNANNLSLILNSEENTNRLISEIIQEAKLNNYGGIDLDIESTKLQDKELFFSFLEKLGSELDKINKKLVFTALPKYTDLFYTSSFKQTLRVQDYARIGEIVDELRIMTYEFTDIRSEIGPVQPLAWQEAVIQYSILQGVPREKLVLGVATYSYDWESGAMTESIDLKVESQPNTLESFQAGVSLLGNDIKKIKDNYEFTEEFNTEWGEMILKYTFKGTPRIVIYPTSQSIQERKELAARYGIKGIAYWKLGSEGDLKL